MKKIIITAVICAFTFASSRLMSSGNGAVKVTSAPGEGTCVQCHGGSTNSDPSGSVLLSIAGNPVNYGHSMEYLVSVTTSYTGRSKFGFALSAKTSSNADLGSFSTNGNANVQVPGSYVTHTPSGTLGSTNAKTWTFKWIAPSTGTSNVTFYVAGLAANANGDDDPGDRVYSSSKTLAYSPTAGLENAQGLSLCAVYPNPSNGTLNLNFQVAESGNVFVKLMDLEGKCVETLLDEMVTKGPYSSLFHLKNDLPAGMYFLQLESAAGSVVKKVFLQ